MDAKAGSVALRASGITKRYPGVIALDDVTISFLEGEVHALVGENGTGKWRIVVGERVSDLRQFKSSYDHALQTSRLISDLKVYERIAFYDDWFIHIQLLSAPREDLERQMVHALGPILDEPELIESLANYLFFGENAKEAAKRTFIHTNTMRYRLGRIQELLEVDLKDSTVRFRLRIGVTIYRFLRG